MFTQTYAKVDAFISAYKNDERGVTAIEYGLIGVAMAVLLGVVLGYGQGSMLGELKAAFSKIGTAINTSTTTTP